MFWIDAKIRIAHPRDASCDAIFLINGKAIKMGRYSRTDDSSVHQQEQEKHEDVQLIPEDFRGLADAGTTGVLKDPPAQ